MTSNIKLALQQYSDVAKELVDRGRLAEAIALYQEAIEQYPNNAELHWQLEIAQEKARGLKGNSALCQNGSATSSQADSEANCLSLESYIGQAQQLIGQGELNKAVVLYKRAIEQYPDRAELYWELGVVQEKLGNISGEVASYRKAIELAKQPSWIYAKLSYLLQQQGSFDKAITVCQWGLHLYPKNETLSYQMMAIQQKQRQSHKSITFLSQEKSNQSCWVSTQEQSYLDDLYDQINFYKKENDLLLLQLHQVQEELEEYFFKVKEQERLLSS